MCILKSLKFFEDYKPEIFLLAWNNNLPCLKNDKENNEDIYRITSGETIHHQDCNIEKNNCELYNIIKLSNIINYKVNYKGNCCYFQIWNCKVNTVEVHYTKNSVLSYIEIVFPDVEKWHTLFIAITNEIKEIDNKITKEKKLLSWDISWTTRKYIYTLKKDKDYAVIFSLKSNELT